MKDYSYQVLGFAGALCLSSLIEHEDFQNSFKQKEFYHYSRFRQEGNLVPDGRIFHNYEKRLDFLG